MTVLIVDPAAEPARELASALEGEGFEVVVAHDRDSVISRLRRQAPQVVVLQADRSGDDGRVLLRELQERGGPPVIVLSARGDEASKLAAFALGVDDYLTVPFGLPELCARIRVVARRGAASRPAPAGRPEVLRVGPLTLNPAEHRARKCGRPLNLSVTEFRLLQQLMENAGRVVPTSELLRQVWGHEAMGNNDLVRLTVLRLRRKIENDPARPQLLQTVPGIGLRLQSGHG